MRLAASLMYLSGNYLRQGGWMRSSLASHLLGKIYEVELHLPALSSSPSHHGTLLLVFYFKHKYTFCCIHFNSSVQSVVNIVNSAVI